MWLAFAVSGFGALVTAAGILAMHRSSEWAIRNKFYFIAFASGVLIAVSFLHLIPEAFELSAMAPAGLLAGYALIHGVDRFLSGKGLPSSRGGGRTCARPGAAARHRLSFPA